jgi:hypothetical protein
MMSQHRKRARRSSTGCASRDPGSTTALTPAPVCARTTIRLQKAAEADLDGDGVAILPTFSRLDGGAGLIAAARGAENGVIERSDPALSADPL